MLTFFKSKYQKIKTALAKTRLQLSYRLKELFGKPWKEETFEACEQILYEADLGTASILELMGSVRELLLKDPDASPELVTRALKQRALAILSAPTKSISVSPAPGSPTVILIVGVNGSGKTTSLAKLGARFKEEGRNPLLVAGDTFRAAATEQLQLWAAKLDLKLIQGLPGADPSALVFDALTAAIARGHDLVLIDTAGRLQNKSDLMQELEKIRRVCNKVVPGAPHETLLVLDATNGQNGLDQAEIFNQFTPLTGLILTKLDGSAKGGIILSIYRKLAIPVRYIGLGESAEDLIAFDKESYVDALFD